LKNASTSGSMDSMARSFGVPYHSTMLTHLFSLIGRSISAIPLALGSTWLGVLFPLIVFVVTELVSILVFGWDAVKRNWGKTVGVGFAVVGVAWTGLFCWCLVKTTYSDHMYLRQTASTYRTAFNKSESGVQAKVGAVRDDLGGQILTLKQECAVKDGINRTLERQNRDQQSSINGCLSEAVKLVTPEPLKITPLILEEKDNQTKFIVLVNKTVTPVNLILVCDQNITSASTWVLGQTIMAGGTGVFASRLVQINIGSPAWSPISPLLVSVTHKENSTPTCSFNLK
jgi:hypothetical protein